MLHRAKDGRMLLLVVGLLLAGVSTALAAEAEPPAQQVNNGCDVQRAGNPECIAPRARPSNGPGDTGYYVGGGAPFRGTPRMASEGTWGWDYSGPFCFRRIDLGWFHGARYQGGTGQYQPDGPRLGRH
jgi:hypothetical protein